VASARYLYMTAGGTIHGPFWLSRMRELWQQGKLNMQTEVCLEGTQRWEPVEFYPEIYEEEARLPVLARMRRAKTDPGRLTVWLILLILALVVWWMRRQGAS
jgi:hypothetical protein